MRLRRLFTCCIGSAVATACALPAIDTNYNPSQGVAGGHSGGMAGTATSTAHAGTTPLGGASGTSPSTSAGAVGSQPASGGAAATGGTAVAGALNRGGQAPLGGAAQAGNTGLADNRGGSSPSGGAPSTGGSAPAGGNTTAAAGAQLTGGSTALSAGGNSTGGLPAVAGSPATAGSAGSTALAISVGAGYEHSCASLSDGTAYCWGYNKQGQLGNGAAITGEIQYSTTPVKVVGLTQAIGLSAGQYFACAALGDSRAKCWGDNSDGTLGNATNGSGTNSSVPVDVLDPSGAAPLTNVAAVVGGNAHACALLKSGNVVCWGDGSQGQLGSNDFGTSTLPVTVMTNAAAPTPLTDVTAIATAYDHTCAVGRDGAVFCWGANGDYQLGDGTQTKRSVAVAVKNLVGAVEVSTGGTHSCARLGDGTVKCWGDNFNDQLGDGSNDYSSSTPVTVAFVGGAKAAAISSSNEHSCAIMANGSRSIQCWGSNAFGQLGNALKTTNGFPVETNIITQAVAIATGDGHSCAATATGAVYCWGANNSGQLGDGNGANNAKSSIPVRVTAF